MKKTLLLILSLCIILFSGSAYAGPSASIGVARGDQDTTTLSTNIVDYDHHEIHSGSHFYYTDWNILASGATAEYILTTPNTTKWAHLTFSMTGSAITEIMVFENTLRSGASTCAILNSNRNKSTASGCTLAKRSVGSLDSGSTIYHMRSGSANVQSRSPMASNRNSEIVLKQNTKYMFRILSGTADNLTNIQLEWYEHTDK